jgi:tetratricopeptide (TPR) repeat protein
MNLTGMCRKQRIKPVSLFFVDFSYSLCYSSVMSVLSVKKIMPLLALGLVLFASCATSKANISGELSAAELIQRAQEASDRNRYKLALQYYELLVERNPTNIDLIITGEYEIAFIHYKQRKYSEAKEEIYALLARYDTPDAELLPSQFKKLSNIVLENIAEKEKPKKIFGITIGKKQAE